MLSINHAAQTAAATDRPNTPRKSSGAFADHRHQIRWLGIAAILLGMAAIAVPHLFSLAVEFLLGGVMAVAGVAEIIRAIRQRRSEGGWWPLLTGILYAAASGVLFFDPVAGVITLTLLLTAVFVAKGVVAIAYSLTERPLPNWGWITASGIASIAVAVLIWAGWPASALWAIGLLTGMELLVFGWALVMVSVIAPAPASD